MCYLKKLIVIAMLAVSFTASAQMHTKAFRDLTPRLYDMIAFSWETAIPSANQYLNEASFSGWRFEYRKKLTPTISVGVAASWNYFSENTPKETMVAPYSDAGTHKAFTFPITMITHYYPKINTGKVLPYLGLGVGAQYAESDLYTANSHFSNNSWGFVARPEFGALMVLPHQPFCFLLGFGTNLSSNSKNEVNTDMWNHFTVNLGIGLKNLSALH
jgi:opacity protein-like surface antigen